MHEAGYVQVAGAVMFTTVTSCLSWNSIERSHWSGPALWYATIVLALACIFTGAQQTLVLPDQETLERVSAQEVERIKLSFTKHGRHSDQPSTSVLFAFQVPIMLLGYTVVCFLAGLCSVVLSPLTRRWNDEAKVGLQVVHPYKSQMLTMYQTAVTFLTISAFSLICWLFPSSFVHRLGTKQAT